jgi:hypothetical protein
MINPAYLPFILAGGAIIFLVIFFHYVPFFLWLSAKVSGVKISLIQLYLIYISTYRPSFTLKLPDILPSERDLACPNYKLPPKSTTKQS